MPREETNPFKRQPEKVGDFFAPFFTVRLLNVVSQEGTTVDPNGKKEATAEITASGEIIVSSGRTTVKFGDSPGAAQYRSYATKLQVTFQGGNPGGAPGGAVMAELTLEPPWEDAQKIIEDRLIHYGTVMVIQWGYESNFSGDVLTSEKHYFTLTQPKLEARGTDVSLTLTGVDMFGGSAPRRTTLFPWDRALFPTDAWILGALAQKNKLRIDFSLAPQPAGTLRARRDVGPLHLRAERTGSPLGNVLLHKNRPATPDEPKVVIQRESDFLFFNRICERNNCSWFTSGDTIFVVDNNIARTQKAAYRLLFFTPLTTDRDIPIIGFSTQVMQQSLFAPAAANGATFTRADEDKKKVEKDKHDAAKMSDQSQVGTRTVAGEATNDGRSIPVGKLTSLVPNPKFGANTTGTHSSCPNGADGRDEANKAVVRRAETLANMNMECQIPGVPSIMPMQLVRVEGVGDVFGGAYLIMKVVHKIGTDGYDCDVTLIREASTSSPTNGPGQRPRTGGQNPKQEPPGQKVAPGGPNTR